MCLSGLQKSNLVILAARPGQGKSSLDIEYCANISVSKDKLPIGIFSLEMSKEELVESSVGRAS